MRLLDILTALIAWPLLALAVACLSQWTLVHWLGNPATEPSLPSREMISHLLAGGVVVGIGALGLGHLLTRQP